MALPFCPLPHDWDTPVPRQTRYPVRVLERRDGSEQRLLLSDTPVVETRYAHVLSTIEEGSEFRAFLWTVLGDDGDRRCWIPRWEDGTDLTAAVSAGGTTLPVASGALDERAFAAGGTVLLWRPSPTSRLVVETATVDSLTDTSVVLTAGVAADWPLGTRVFPVSVGRLAGDVDVQRLHPPYGRVSLAYELDARDLAGVGTGGTGAAGVPAAITVSQRVWIPGQSAHVPEAMSVGPYPYAGAWEPVYARVTDASGLELREQAITWSVVSSAGPGAAAVHATPDPHVAVVFAQGPLDGAIDVTATLGALSHTLRIDFRIVSVL